MAASIIEMAVNPKQLMPGAPHLGFVMAMRARLTTTRRPRRDEWLIVSRWGVAGEYMSVGRTRFPALPGMDAPIDLRPRQTMLARLLRLPVKPGPHAFLFVRRKPESVSVAGGFAPTEGYVRLHRNGAMLLLCAEGRCFAGALRSPWHIEAVRVPWIGEFFEGDAAPVK
jgi:hypothetical protein